MGNGEDVFINIFVYWYNFVIEKDVQYNELSSHKNSSERQSYIFWTMMHEIVHQRYFF